MKWHLVTCAGKFGIVESCRQKTEPYSGRMHHYDKNVIFLFSFSSVVHGRGGVPGHLLVRALGRPPPPGGGGLAQALPPVHAIRLPGADAAGRSRAGG